MAGYINCFGERFDHLTHSGKVGPVSEGVIYYDVDTSKGQSGAPVFIKNNNKLVGIHKGYSPEDKLNFGTLITKEMIEILRAWGLEMITLFTVVSWTLNEWFLPLLMTKTANIYIHFPAERFIVDSGNCVQINKNNGINFMFEIITVSL